MSRLRFGLVGCGRISKKHIKVLKELSEHCEIVSVCDINANRAQAAGEETGARVFTDVREMLTSDELNLDVVSILTWSGNHSSIAMQCIGKVPNIVIEKPMALRLQDADALINAAQRTGTRLFVVKQNRYNPPVVALRQAMNAGRFGRLVLGTVRVRWCRKPEYYKLDPWRGTWEWDGGVLTNQASHHIDLLTWFLGPVTSVTAKIANYLSPIETEDTGIVLLQFKSGALGVVEATTCARPTDLEGSLSVLGEKGAVEIGGFAVNKLKVWQFEEPCPDDEQVWQTSTEPPDVYGFGHRVFYEEVIAAIVNEMPFMIDGVEGRRSLELINAIYESAESGREINLGFTPKKCKLGTITPSLSMKVSSPSFPLG